VTLLEDAGLAGCHLEDQVNPKRCGHLDGKAVVATADMVKRLRAAVAARRDPNFVICARTDAAGVEGVPAAIERSRAYADAGADMIFTEALDEVADFERFRAAVDIPLLANVTEFGRSPLLTARTLGDIGYNAVIYPVTRCGWRCSRSNPACANWPRRERSPSCWSECSTAVPCIGCCATRTSTNSTLRHTTSR
jgi:methylisocitrate lyase